MQLRTTIMACTQTLVDHVEELTALDAAIGDGDHGLNMKRGALAIQAKLPELETQSLNEALKTMGMTCMSTIGVRPDGSKLRLANGHDSGHARAVVRRVEHLGDQTHVYVALGGVAIGEIELVALCRDTSGLEPGRAVSVEFSAPLFFDDSGRRIRD